VDGGGGAGVEEEGGVGELRVLGSKNERVRSWAQDWKSASQTETEPFTSRNKGVALDVPLTIPG
jgi:hypothetical protein